MTQRSPLHERYQRNTAPAGRTRRSASAAKPKREAGATAGATKSGKGKSGRPTLRQSLRTPLATSPEIQRWSRIRWGLFAFAISLMVLVWLVPTFRANNTLTYAAFVVYAIALGLAILVDFVKIRPLREKAAAEAKQGKAKRDGKG